MAVRHGYTDSDFAGDRADRKSPCDFLFYEYGGPIDWQSKKQLLVATSTTESEYGACCEATQKGQMPYSAPQRCYQRNRDTDAQR